MGDDLVGVWRLKSHVMENLETGERSEPFGPHPRGTLIVHPAGRMVALITPGEPSTPAGEDAPAAAARNIVAYSGRYRLEPQDRLVTSVDVASLGAWVGTDQVRGFRRDGDRLEIVTTPPARPGDGGPQPMLVGTLSWIREA